MFDLILILLLYILNFVLSERQYCRIDTSSAVLDFNTINNLSKTQGPMTNNALVFDGSSFADFGTTQFGGQDININFNLKLYDNRVSYRVLYFASTGSGDECNFGFKVYQGGVQIVIKNDYRRDRLKYSVDFEQDTYYHIFLRILTDGTIDLYIDNVLQTPFQNQQGHGQGINLCERDINQIGNEIEQGNESEFLNGEVDEFYLFAFDLSEEQRNCINDTCQYDCNTCQSQSSNCQICQGNNRSTTPPCICNEGFYNIEDQSDCGECDQKCSTCTNTSSECDTCSENRENPPNCECISNFVENSEGVCQSNCPSICDTCNFSSECLTCAENRDNEPTCDCINNYEENSEGICELVCPSICDTCDSTGQCLTCAENRDNEPTCGCQNNYEENSEGVCELICPSICDTCDSTGQCLTCAGNRDNQPTCGCQNNYEENSEGICELVCPSICDTCDSTGQCLTCAENRDNEPTCGCQNNYEENSQGVCELVCPSICDTCDSTGQCLTCAENRDNEPTCGCQNNYEENSEGVCELVCPSICDTCDSTGQCLTCAENRESEPTCGCIEGYYEANLACYQCDSQCNACENTSNYCTVCSQYRSGTPTCNCREHYELNEENNCQLMEDTNDGEENNNNSNKKETRSYELIIPESQLTQEEQEAVETTAKVTETSSVVLESTLLGLGAAGNFYLFVNLIDQTQLIYYMIFLEIKYPENLLKFYDSFKFFQFPFIPNLFSSLFDTGNSETDYSVKGRYEDYGLNSFFFNNTGQSFMILLIMFAIFLFLLAINPLFSGYPRIKKFLHYKIEIQCRWNAFIEIIWVIYINIVMSSLLQFQGINGNSTVEIMNYVFWGISSVIFFGFPIYFSVQLKNYLKHRNILFKQRFENLWDGLKTENNGQIQFGMLLYYRKAFFSMIIVLLFGYPVLQLILISVLNMILIGILIKYKPYQGAYNNKVNVVTEFILCVINVILISTQFSDPDYVWKNEGWIIITLILVLILIHLILLVVSLFWQIRHFFHQHQEHKRRQAKVYSIKGFDAKVLQKLHIPKKLQKIDNDYKYDKDVIQSQILKTSLPVSQIINDNDTNINNALSTQESVQPLKKQKNFHFSQQSQDITIPLKKSRKNKNSRQKLLRRNSSLSPTMIGKAFSLKKLMKKNSFQGEIENKNNYSELNIQSKINEFDIENCLENQEEEEDDQQQPQNYFPTNKISKKMSFIQQISQNKLGQQGKRNHVILSIQDRNDFFGLNTTPKHNLLSKQTRHKQFNIKSPKSEIQLQSDAYNNNNDNNNTFTDSINLLRNNQLKQQNINLDQFSSSPKSENILSPSGNIRGESNSYYGSKLKSRKQKKKFNIQQFPESPKSDILLGSDQKDFQSDGELSVNDYQQNKFSSQDYYSGQNKINGYNQKPHSKFYKEMQ